MSPLITKCANNNCRCRYEGRTRFRSVTRQPNCSDSSWRAKYQRRTRPGEVGGREPCPPRRPVGGHDDQSRGQTIPRASTRSTTELIELRSRLPRALVAFFHLKPRRVAKGAIHASPSDSCSVSSDQREMGFYLADRRDR